MVKLPDPPQLDYDEFLPDLDDLDMTLEQKRQFLDELWRMMEAFVDVAWGTDAASLAMQAQQAGVKADADE